MVSPLASITDRVMEALDSDPRTRNANIDVACTGSIVTISGIVRSQATSDAAEEIARSQPGVATVINELKVV